MTIKRARLGAGLILALAVTLAAPAGAALAASATVTGNDGNPVALDPAPTIRHMSPDVAFAFAPTEERYAVTVTGPSGQPASGGQSCGSTGFPSSERIRYQGNGTYTVTLLVSTDDSDSNCAAATTQTFTFVISASTAIGAPGSPTLRMRPPDSGVLTPFEIPVDVHPGADAHELRYAANATLGADVLLENLACVATATMAARTLIDQCAVEPARAGLIPAHFLEAEC